jgi:peroxiredoxin
MPTKVKIILVIIALAALAGGILVGGYITKQETPQTAARQDKPLRPSSVIGMPRIDFSLKDTEGKPRKLSEWDGKVVMINFWATWCPPCRREIPAFIELQEKYRDKGFAIIGVALDTPQAAMDFVDPMGINYPILVGEEEGIVLTQQYGNHLGVLPYSVILDRKGSITHTLLHELTYEEVEKLISPLM